MNNSVRAIWPPTTAVAGRPEWRRLEWRTRVVGDNIWRHRRTWLVAGRRRLGAPTQSVASGAENGRPGRRPRRWRVRPAS